MKDLVIVGSGGFARETKWLIERCNAVEARWNIMGWISNEEVGTIIDGIPVIGGDEWLMKYDKELNVVIAIGDGKMRKKLSDMYSCNSMLMYPNIIAPSAILSESVRLGKGCIIADQSVLTINISAGDFFVSSIACVVSHDCEIDNFVTLLPGSHISGNVTVGECTSVGVGANVIQGLNIGKNVFLGAGAVLITNLPDNCTAVGVPAKVLEK